MESPRKFQRKITSSPDISEEDEKSEPNLLSEMKKRKEYLKSFEQRNKQKLELLSRAITESEKLAFSRLKLCNIKDFSYNGINLDNLRSYLSDSFVDIDVMEITKCLITSIISRKLNENIYDNLERIRYWIRKLKLLSLGSFGLTMTAFINDGMGVDKDLILKLPQEEYISDNLFHEMMVGLLALNNLRSYVPNFAYVYGGFSCAHPLIDKNGYVTTYCEYEDNDIQYVLYENISPSTRTDNFLLSATRGDLLNILLQLAISLDLAKRRYDYLHGDLHAGNVLIRDLGQIFSIPYPIYKNNNEYKTIFLNTPFIATIIDYGFSHFTINGAFYGYTGAIERDVFPDKSFPAYDLFKFLISVYKWSGRKPEKGHNEEIGELAIDIINEFFEPEIDIENVLQAKIYSPLPILPRTPKYEALTYSSFIEFILVAYPDDLRGIYSENVKYPVFSCNSLLLDENDKNKINNEYCPNIDELYEILEISPNNVPSDPYEFMDLVKSLTKGELKDEIIEGYDYYNGFSIIKDKIKDIKNNLTKLLDSTPNIKLKDVKITDRNELNKYRDSIDNVGRMINEVTTYDTYEKSYNFLVEISKPYIDTEIKPLNSEWLHKVRKALKNRIDQIKEDTIFAKIEADQDSITYKNLYSIIRWF